MDRGYNQFTNIGVLEARVMLFFWNWGKYLTYFNDILTDSTLPRGLQA